MRADAMLTAIFSIAFFSSLSYSTYFLKHAPEDLEVGFRSVYRSDMAPHSKKSGGSRMHMKTYRKMLEAMK